MHSRFSVVINRSWKINKNPHQTPKKEMKAPLLLPLLLLVTLSHSHTVRTTGDCPLNCWIANLNVTISGDTPVAISGIAGVSGTVYLKDINIHGLSLKNLSAKWWPDETASTGDAVKIRAQGVSIQLATTVRTDITVVFIPIKLTLPLTASVYDADASLVLQLVKNATDGLIDAVKMPEDMTLDFTIDTDNTHIGEGLTDTVSKALIKLLAGALPGIVESAINPVVKQLIETNITALFDTLNSKITRPYMHRTQPRNVTVVTKGNETMVDLRVSPLIDAARFALNNLTGAGGDLNFNMLVNRLSHDTGVISLAQFYNKSIAFTIPIASLGANITAGIKVSIEFPSFSCRLALFPVFCHFVPFHLPILQVDILSFSDFL